MLRDYQIKLINDVHASWAKGNRNVLATLATGGGKTYTFCHIIKQHAEQAPVYAIAHRQELVGQMSLALASMGIQHSIIGSDATVSEIVKVQRKQFNQSFYSPSSRVVCCSVDTLIRRPSAAYAQAGLWVMDEAHHVLRANKWGEAVRLFPNAMGLGVTATPIRADGKGLGAHADGVMHDLVRGPTGQMLIRDGYLSPYVVATASVDDLQINDLEVGTTGDVKQNQLATATKASRKLVGCIVDNYIKHGYGKRGITFAVDSEHGNYICEQFRAKGIPSAFVSHKTPFAERARILDAFRQGIVWNLINVDLFGEGFDVPAAEIISLARYTESFGLYSQQLGRGLRPLYAEGYDCNTVEGRRTAIAASTKPRAVIIDHVGCCYRHGFPTMRDDFTLDARERRGRREVDKDDKVKSCLSEACGLTYLAHLNKCPFCGYQHKAAEDAPKGKTIAEVQGDLIMLDPEVVHALAHEADRVVGQVHIPQSLPRAAQLSLIKKHAERADAQRKLRDAIALWGGYHTQAGLDVSETQKLFYITFGVDVLTAQTHNARDANTLMERVNNDTQRLVG